MESRNPDRIPLTLNIDSIEWNLPLACRVHPIFWLCGFGAAIPPCEEAGPAHVFEAASDGEQAVGTRFRPVAHRSFEPVPDDLLAGAVHAAGSDRQAARPVEVVAHSIPVGLIVADACLDVIGPVAMRLQVGDDVIYPPRK